MSRLVDADLRRSQLTDATAQEIARAGLEGLSLRHVARAAGWTTGALSHYFVDKDDLLLATFRSRADLARRRRDEAIASGTSRLQAAVESALPLDAERTTNWKVFLAFWSSAIGDGALHEAQRDRHESFKTSIEAALVSEQSAGRLRPDIDVVREARRLVALLNGIAVQALVDAADWPPSEQLRCVEAHLEGLR
jgi:AcrR family transcriptional regulator